MIGTPHVRCFTPKVAPNKHFSNVQTHTRSFSLALQCTQCLLMYNWEPSLEYSVMVGLSQGLPTGIEMQSLQLSWLHAQATCHSPLDQANEQYACDKT